MRVMKAPHDSLSDQSNVATGPVGQVGHKDLIAHSARFERKLWEVRPGVWSLVGNGLSNQSFIEGPEGLIAIDTGESVEEMAAALAEVRQHTQAPVVAVLYTHFHYVAGTQAIIDEAGHDLAIWGHKGIVGNRQRMSSEVSAAAGRGLVHQFGMLLPADGPDALINVGLGREFRSQSHAPFTGGFVAPDHTISEATKVRIAGLEVEFMLAPSDADDSLTIWFPELGVAVNNLVWPSLFNVFAIRGEEYRDPRILLSGLDDLSSLNPEHLLGAHGPPLSGRELVAEEIETYRDSIQFMWDQTVRGINRGLTLDELTCFVQLPAEFGQTYLTRQFYGLVEHHVRQIHAGLRGWFDGDEAALFAVPPLERATRLIDGFGGAAAVRSQAQAALDEDDIRWALELASWLVRTETNQHGRVDGGTPEDRNLLASALRAAARRTTSSNVRNWALTRALELEGSVNLGRFRVHRFSRANVIESPATTYVETLRVLVDPQKAAGLNVHVRFVISGEACGLHIRRGVAALTDGKGAAGELQTDLETWASILASKMTTAGATEADLVQITGDPQAVETLLGCFDHASLSVL